MKLKISNPFYHVLFWLVVVGLLTIIFGRSWGSGLNAFYFISMLLPVVMGTSYFFNYYMVPYFLLKKKYFLFSLYFFDLIVISLYLQMVVVFFSFIYLANFSFSEMHLGTKDVKLLGIVMYLIVFVGSFLIMLQQLSERQKELLKLKEEKQKNEQAFLELKSNRKLVRISYDDILYIESLSDYIRVHSVRSGKITSKEKISAISEMLPERFVRIHRSFIINADKVSRVTASEVYLNDIQLNIGRTYKKEVAQALKAT